MPYTRDSFCTPHTCLSNPRSAATCDHNYLSTSSSGLQPSLIFIHPIFTYLEHLMTLLLLSFTSNLLLPHTLPNSEYESSKSHLCFESKDTNAIGLFHASTNNICGSWAHGQVPVVRFMFGVHVDQKNEKLIVT